MSERTKVAGHAFISYVREDSDRVDQLQAVLERAGIPVWRDTADLWPGQDWREHIQRAITDNALAFIACFSRNSTGRPASYQNEELRVAIEQLQLRRPDDPWIIPVRFDDCDIPDRDLGGGRQLAAIQRADLFGAQADHAAARLVAVVRRILERDVGDAAARPTYLVGIDSGGTHTNIRIITPDGPQNVPEIARSLTSNRSNAELQSILKEIFAAVRKRTADGDAYVWISAAGYADSTRDRFTRLLRSAINHSNARIGICNDAVALLLANEAETVIVVAGTGSSVMAKLPSGKVITRGGDEWVASDYGSAFWIGLEGIRAAYRAVEEGEETALKDCLAAQYRPLTLEEPGADERQVAREIVRHLASQGTGTKPAIAQFAEKVTRQAEKGDPVAQSIVQRAVAELASSATRVYRELAEHAETRPVPRFLISGGVAFGSSFYAEAFRAALNQNLFAVREHSDDVIEPDIQLNGIGEAVELAKRLQSGQAIPDLDDVHSYSIIDGSALDLVEAGPKMTARP